MKKISILGVSGSIGRQTLEVCQQLNELGLNDQIKICAMTANSDWRFLGNAARKFLPSVVAIGDISYLKQLKKELADLPIKVLGGDTGLADAASLQEVDMVVAAISGLAGLAPLLAAIYGGKKKIALANKETLVSAGEIVTRLAGERNVEILPVDSEHSAIWQCLQGEARQSVSKLILTASGGPFRNFAVEQLSSATPEQALAHPNWKMGAKVTIDSATMVNKGLEIIEAHWLFGLPYDRIEVLVHPQSIIHSLVEYLDGNQKALLSLPDMRLPIQYALTEQERPRLFDNLLDLAAIGELTFYCPDSERFPGLDLFRQAGERGGSAPAYLNAANEVLVEAFLARKISFTNITAILSSLFAGYNSIAVKDISQVYLADKEGRQDAIRQIAESHK